MFAWCWVTIFFYGHGLSELLLKVKQNVENEQKATIFGYNVSNPQRYGVAEFDKCGNVISIEEKPQKPASNFAVVGLYFYTSEVVALKPSKRGELEITSVNQTYLNQGKLKVELMGRGYAWLDTGTHESLLEASQFVETIEKRQGLKIACLEEIAYKKQFIDDNKLQKLIKPLQNTSYGYYLSGLLE